MSAAEARTDLNMPSEPDPTKDELARENARLRDEAASLRELKTNLVHKLQNALADCEADRRTRNAALNLMEDAIAARQAEQRASRDRYRTEGQLRTSEDKYRTLFESIDDGFFIIERIDVDETGAFDFRFLEANPAFATQSGVRDVFGKTMRQVFLGESEEWYSTFDNVISTGESIRFERELITQARELELYAFRLKRGTRGQVAVLFKDITERKAAEKALQEADRRKDEFLATLAHELRNPLAPICSSLDFLRLSSGNDPEIEDVYNMMERQLKHMVRLVDDLMEVSRITRGKIELRKEPINLAAVIENAIEISRPLIEARGHELLIALPGQSLRLYGDAMRLGQVFGNLLHNAAKYTDRLGKIWLAARQEGNEIVVSVQDNGIGIPEPMLTSIFDMFVQADWSSNRVQGGLGIGLTLARRLIEMHGGTMTAHSRGLGKGSEFIVRLPAAAPQIPQTNGPVASVRPGEKLETRRVLVVDDNEDSAASLGTLLRSLGMDVQTSHDGTTALKMIDEYHPDLVLLDIGMPGMDGFEVARRIRARPDNQRLKLVALTGWGQDTDRARTQEAGFDHHLVKPAQATVLQSLLMST
jgi:PAS domain S-box-containing protein